MLVEFKWDVDAAAEHVGITYSTMYKKTKKFGIVRPAEFPIKNWNRGKTHCKRSHEFTVANTFPNEFGYRKCRQCSIEYVRKVSNGPVLVPPAAPKTLSEIVQWQETHRRNVR